MEKSLFTREYAVAVILLRRLRKEAGLTQVDLAQRLHTNQGFVSKIELAGRRLDLLEARAFCLALGVPFVDYIQRLERDLARLPREEAQ